MAKTLYILRHAKTEVGTAGQEDHARRLVRRGVEAAQIMGAYMFNQHILPNKIMCSDATRTRETWAQIESVYIAPMNVEFSHKLYLSSAHEMAGMLEKLPEQVASVLMVAHNPGVHQLCLKLAKEGDEDVLDVMFLKFPTCALAIIELDNTPWSGIGSARGTLINFITPKMLAGLGDD